MQRKAVTPCVANAVTKTAGTTTTDRVCECKIGFKGDAATDPSTCTACQPDVNFQDMKGQTQVGRGTGAAGREGEHSWKTGGRRAAEAERCRAKDPQGKPY